MGRSGYSDDYDGLALGRWRGQVKSALRGKRGQALLVDLVRGLEALPEKKLIMDVLEDAEGAVCALGAVGKFRGVPMTGSNLDVEDHVDLGMRFDIARQLVAEVMYENDEIHGDEETPEERWVRMRRWALGKLTSETVLTLGDEYRP